jgi:hypothetical protein
LCYFLLVFGALLSLGVTQIATALGRGKITVPKIWLAKDLSRLTIEELKRLRKRAAEKPGNEQLAALCDDELTSRSPRKVGGKVNKKTGDSSGFIWKTRDQYTSTLFHNGEIVAEIIKDGNHTLNNKDVYHAHVFGKSFRRFEYIGPAKVAVREKVEQELARGGGQPSENDDPRGSGSPS